MSSEVEEFIAAIVEIGSLAPEDLQSITHDSGNRPATVDELASAMLEQGKVTSFQLEKIRSGRGAELRLENYVLLKEIGAGAIGKVYLALHRRMNRKVAIKVLGEALLGHGQAIDRFQREVRAAAQLSHPNIVTAFDADKSGDTDFFVMEYVEGTDLAKLVSRCGPLSVLESVECIRQIAMGLDYAHSRGIVHRDIKPGNLILDTEGVVRILDMGLAKYQQEEEPGTDLTATGVAMGTVDFMAPEQGLNAKAADSRSDLYSLGCTLYYLVTGARLYQASSAIKMILAHQKSPAPSLVNSCPAAGTDVEEIYQRLVAKKPAARYQSASELVDDLSAIVESLSAIHGISPRELADRLKRIAVDSGTLPATQRSSQQWLEAQSIARTESIVSEVTCEPSGLKSSLWNMPVLVAVVAFMVLSVVAVYGFVFNSPTPGSPRQNAELGLANSVPELPLANSVSELPQIGEKPLFPKGTRFALAFDGMNNYVTLPVRFDGTRPLTIEAIVIPGEITGAVQQIACSAEGNGISLHISPEGKIAFHYRVSGGEYQAIRSDAPVTAGELTYVTAIADDQHLRLGINGKPAAEPVAISGVHVPSQLSLTLGANESPGKPQDTQPIKNAPESKLKFKEFFRGYLAGLRVSKAPRDFNEVLSFWELPEDSSTLAIYRCDEPTPASLTDSSRDQKHGIIYGARWVNESDVVKELEEPQAALRSEFAKTQSELLQQTFADGARVRVHVYAKRANFAITSTQEIPSSPFLVDQIQFASVPVTIRNISDLNSFDSLMSLQLFNSTFDSMHVDELAKQRIEIGAMAIHDNPLKTSEIERLNKLGVKRLILSCQHVDDDWGFIEALPNLRQLVVDRPTLSDIELICQHANLRLLVLKQPGPLDAKLVHQMQSNNPNLRVVTEQKGESRILGKDHLAEIVDELTTAGWGFVGDKCPREASDVADHASAEGFLSIGSFSIPEGKRSVREFKLALKLDEGGFFYSTKAKRQVDSDSLCEKLLRHLYIVDLNLDGSDLTDTGLAFLAGIPRLKHLDVSGTSVTRSGIESFRQKSTYTMIQSDFGTFLPLVFDNSSSIN